jgi:probable rRNA maturation factor
MTPAEDFAVEVEIEAEAWTTALPRAEAVVRQAALAALGAETRRGVVILLTDDDRQRELNRRFRDKDAPTNVLSFPAPAHAPGGGGDSLGDIALAFGVCEGEARAQRKTLADHLRHLVIHGVLHLMGHDHEEDAAAETMEALERRLLAGMGVADPYAAELVESIVEDDPRHGR